MTIKAYIDETGIHIPQYQEIVDDLKKMWRSIFGEDLYLETDSQEGEALELFALCLNDAYQFCVATYQAFSPQTSQGAGLSRMVKINGIRRRPATKSYADVRIVGVAGTTITGGIVEDIAGQKWNLPPAVTIPYEGEIIITATAQESGVIRAQPGDINKIATPTRGWQTVENPSVAIAGRAAETDAELRIRQTISTALPAQTILEAITAAVADLDNVTQVRPYENDKDEANVHGLPPHSFSLVVDGGEAQEIAEAIHNKKGPGPLAYGDVIIPVTDSTGLVTGIGFFRPDIIDITVSLILRRLPGYSDEITIRIKDNLVAYIASLGIGNSVILSKLYAPIDIADYEGASADQIVSPRQASRFEVMELLIAKTGETPASQNIPIAFDGMALLSAEDITVNFTVEQGG